MVVTTMTRKLQFCLLFVVVVWVNGLRAPSLPVVDRPNVQTRPAVRLFQAVEASKSAAELQPVSLPRQLLAELVGTFLLVNVGTGAVMSGVFTNSLGLFSIAAVWSVAVTIAISVTGKFSGAHLNPAISLCFALFRPNKSFGWKKVLPYTMAQLCGAMLGSAVNLFLYSSTIQTFEATQGIIRSSGNAIGSAKAFGEYFASPVTTTQAFGAEALGTAILAAVVFALTHPDNDNPKDLVAPMIGLTVGALICVLAPLTQAGFNPARDFGPRIVAAHAGWSKVAFQSAWVYIVAPCVGAIAGAFFVDKVLFQKQ